MGLFKRIDTNFIPVKDIEESINWYKDILGLKLMWNEGDYAAFNVNTSIEGQANIELGHAMITLVKVYNIKTMDFDYESKKHAMFNFYTIDIQATHDSLKEKGVKVSDINDYGNIQVFDFLDINGHTFGVCHF